MKRLSVLLVLTLLAACHAVPDVESRVFTAKALAASAQMEPFASGMAGEGAFTLQGFRRLSTPGAALTVYIEGDGRAWLTRHTPSPDPTPINPVALHLAVHDASPNVIYLARPGQYGADGVDSRYWLSARFAPEVIDAYLQTLRALLAETQARELHLVGFSGGGAIAALLAARLQGDAGVATVTLQTFGGNLDIEVWSQTLRITPLRDSLNPADEAKKLSRVPQRHFIGLRDRQVPREVLESFLGKLPDQHCVQVVEVDVPHGGPWPDARSGWTAMPGCGL